jgi:hypothetical protein
MANSKRKVIFVSVAIVAMSTYLAAPYFIIESLITNPRNDISASEFTLGSFYNLAYVPLLSALPNDFWYKKIMLDHANALCKTHPDNCATSEPAQNSD